MSDEEIRRSLERRASDVEPTSELRQRVADREPVTQQGPSAARRVAIAVFALAVSAAAFALIIPGGNEQGAVGSTTPSTSEPPVARELETIELEGGVGRVIAAEGSLWISGEGHVLRVDPSTGEVLAEIPVRLEEEGSYPSRGRVAPDSGLVYGDGLIWVTAEPFFAAIDPATNELATTIVWSSGVMNIAWDEGALLYGGSAEGNGQVVRLDPETLEFDAFPTSTGAYPLVLATDHWIWAGGSDGVGAGALDRWSRDRQVEETVDGITRVHALVEAGGWVWALDDRFLYRVNAYPAGPQPSPQSHFPSSVEAIDLTVPLPPVPGRGTLASDGEHLWLLVEAGAVCQLTELDTATGEAIGDPIEIHIPFPAEMAVLDGVPWITYRDEGLLVHPELPS